MEKEKTSNSPKTTPKPTGPILGLPDDDPNGNYLTIALFACKRLYRVRQHLVVSILDSTCAVYTIL